MKTPEQLKVTIRSMAEKKNIRAQGNSANASF